MALLFIDSFDHYSTAQMSRKWTSLGGGAVIQSGGRTSNCMMASNGGPSKTVGAGTYSSLAVGVAYNTQNLSNTPIRIQDATGSLIAYLQHVGDGRLFVRVTFPPSSSWSSANSTFVMNTNVWYYLELQVTISAGAVTYAAQANGASILSGTMGSGLTGTWDQVALIAAGGGNNSYFDDFYVTDGELLGDIRIYPLYPRLDGTTLQWVPSAGTTHFNLVNEHAPDDAASYVSCSSANVGNQDQYYLDQITGFSGTIKGAQGLWCLTKSDAGTASVLGVYRNGAGTIVNTANTFNPSYPSWQYFTEAQRKSVFTSSDWTATEINSMQLGLLRNS